LAGIELFLFEVETIFAIEIADRSNGLGEEMKRPPGGFD
jgi:hypothetical protein